ncbi:WXG100 protein secretion system (Wss), protein YukD [Actinomyces denticolens]|uniref:WXG100 protein secretion system (Wss), protein YukD n=1 Tax=Actinomyces denticolens TaxID=52767 RepID=A0ABY1IHN5_9ACTO|nr:EsaB/YukD family protein [Actinomyces denticolens]SHJ18557.1 WXG100 protein secretion system (Wss), protein YukD [Actinomyces denticolens]
MPYTRLTLVTERSRAEVVLPSDEPVGIHMPMLMDLLGLTVGNQIPSVSLVRPDGALVDPELDLAGQSVFDGEMIRVVADDQAPAPMQVADISNGLAEATDTHPDRWSERDRMRLVGSVAAIALASAIWPWASTTVSASTSSAWVALLPGALAVAAESIIAAASGRYRAVAGTLGGLLACGLLLPGAWAAHTAGAAIPSIILLLACSGAHCLGQRRTGWASGMLLGLGLVGIWVALERVAAPSGIAHGAMGLICLVVLGVLPWSALTSSGISRLDDDAMAGRLTDRHRLHRSIRHAHDHLLSAVLVTAIGLGASASALAAHSDPWATALTLCLSLAVVLRSRAFPLSTEVAALWLAALVPVLVLSARIPEVSRPWAIGAAVIIITTTSLLNPAARDRIRLRRIGDRLETLATVATFPLLCGLSGLYSHLLAVLA